MPTATPELQAEWHNEQAGYDRGAIAFLESRGYTLRRDWCWLKPCRFPEDDEIRAIHYLIQEWDFGGIVDI